MEAPPDRPDGVARVMLRPLGSPLPLGFFAFGVGVLLIGAFDFGWIPPSDTSGFAAILLAFVVPLELIPSVLAFLSRDTAGGTTLGVFAMSWAATGVALLVEGGTGRHPALGFFWFAVAGVVLLLAVTALQGKPFFAAVLSLATVRFVLGGLHAFLGIRGLAVAGGVVGFVLTGVAYYGATALLLEDLQQRSVLPLFRKGSAARALEGDLRTQLERVSREAGVRQQL